MFFFRAKRIAARAAAKAAGNIPYPARTERSLHVRDEGTSPRVDGVAAPLFVEAGSGDSMSASPHARSADLDGRLGERGLTALATPGARQLRQQLAGGNDPVSGSRELARRIERWCA